ncbi:MAG: glutathione transferase GstA [Myxococcales bacterium]|nr:glutathione transferase GstA [Myxococcales bacterium]
MKLYYSPGACSLAAHIVLREADRRFDLERVDLKTKRTASGRDYIEINPKGYVPALELDGGSEILTEVQVILQYVADLAPEQHLIAAPGTLARYHTQEMLAFIATELHKQFSPLFKHDTPPAVQATQRGKISDRLTYLQDVLADRAFLMGETFSAPDAYLFVMLQWGHKLGIDIPLWPILDDYEQRIAHRPAVEAALAAEGLLRHPRQRKTA